MCAIFAYFSNFDNYTNAVCAVPSDKKSLHSYFVPHHPVDFISLTLCLPHIITSSNRFLGRFMDVLCIVVIRWPLGEKCARWGWGNHDHDPPPLVD